MSDSPYRSPQPTDQLPSGDTGKVGRVANYQKFVIYVLLANIGVTVLSMATRAQGGPIVFVGLALGLVIAIAAMVAIFIQHRDWRALCNPDVRALRIADHAIGRQSKRDRFSTKKRRAGRVDGCEARNILRQRCDFR